MGGKTIPITAVTIRERCYDPDVDAYLVRGTIRKTKQAVTGWQSRHTKTLTACSYFPDEARAGRHYKKLLADTEKPDLPSLLRDWQKAAVYAWEEKFLMPAAAKLNRAQAQALVDRVSRDYAIPTPKLVWAAFNHRSEYDPDEHAIIYGARDNITLLHELAHAIHTEKLDDEETADHAPGFVWCAAELYNRYAGIDLDHLVLSAGQQGILGDLKTVRRARPNHPIPH